MSTAESAALRWYEKHEAALLAAGRACRERSYFSLFPETPDRHRGGAAAAEAASAAFRAQLGRPFELEQPGTAGRLAGEVSPYTLEPLGIDYPRADPDALFEAARAAMPRWAALSAQARLGVCMEIVDRLYEQRIRDRAGGDAYSRAEFADELYGQRHQCTGSRRRSAGLRAALP